MGSHGIRDRVAIIGMGCTRFAEHWDKSRDDLTIDACQEAFASAGIGKDDVDAFWLGTAQSGMSGMVLSQALQNVFGLALEDSRRPENRSLMQSPDAQTGFVLNRHSHWYCLRKLNNQWWPSAEETPASGAPCAAPGTPP